MYLLNLKVARENLRWIFIVLGLLITSALFEIAVCSRDIHSIRINSPKLGTAGYAIVGFIVTIGGFTSNISFAVFALEYYKAAFTIAMALEGKSRIQQLKLHQQIFIVEVVFIMNFVACWILVSVFETAKAINDGSTVHGAHSDDLRAYLCRIANAGGMYLMAGFLVIALFKIKNQLASQDFNTFTLAIHMFAVFAAFFASFLSLLAQFIFSDSRVSSIIFLVGALF